ncbi:hypothetical protein [Methanimicrococcus blatticola]|uniref:hypothetical protein n=1 Tax=Methanimicrococcus blatticola TaxID=91560 RepID=UPI00141528F7|nr:hypothetical protein [Methanimicrococcus blatticola]MBZ3935026.1 hypothetical protein [Methanimicrococcus blatticola]
MLLSALLRLFLLLRRFALLCLFLLLRRFALLCLFLLLRASALSYHIRSLRERGYCYLAGLLAAATLLFLFAAATLPFLFAVILPTPLPLTTSRRRPQQSPDFSKFKKTNFCFMFFKKECKFLEIC